MRKYELVCIVQPELDETAFKGVVDRVSGWISEAGGSVDKVDVWGRRRMAYQIRKQREGQYVLLNLTLDPSPPAIWSETFATSNRSCVICCRRSEF